MNRSCKTLLCCALTLSPALAKEGYPATNVSTSVFELSDRTESERTEFLLGVAQAYLQESKLIEAISAFERVLEIDPKHLQSRYTVALLCIETKQYTKAISIFEGLIIALPEDFRMKNNLAWLYATSEDPKIRDVKKAIKYAQEALTLAPDDYQVWSTLAEAYYSAGKYKKAYRAISHTADLVRRYGADRGITRQTVNGYNKQILKCQRALDAADVMKKESEK